MVEARLQPLQLIEERVAAKCLQLHCLQLLAPHHLQPRSLVSRLHGAKRLWCLCDERHKLNTCMAEHLQPLHARGTFLLKQPSSSRKITVGSARIAPALPILVTLFHVTNI